MDAEPMRVEVTRTSNRNDQPHPSAIRRTMLKADEYQDIPDHALFQRMKREGRNARPTGSFTYAGFEWIEADFPREVWTAEFASLEEALRTLMTEYPVVVSHSGVVGIEWCIEIYDDYRE